jgi:hypothetical protein
VAVAVGAAAAAAVAAAAVVMKGTVFGGTFSNIR